MIPTTPTFASRNAEKKAISDEIAVLKAQKENLTREVKDLVESRKEMQVKSGLAPGDYKKIEDQHVSNMQRMEERFVTVSVSLSELEIRLVEKQEALTDISGKIESKQAYLNSLNTSIEEKKKKLENLQIELEKHTISFNETKDTDIERLTKIRREIDALIGGRNQIIEDLKSRQEKVEEEERLISIKREDLRIYETRFRAKYPNETIIL